jgi:D-beta-D-heptose 7-phosphate kinase/D-beta-D-heptose 1-phosphate adenosyltransferase
MIDYSSFDAVVISDYNKGFLTKDDIYYISNNSKISFLDTKKVLGPWASNISYIKINEFEYDHNKEHLTPDLISRLIITKGSSGADHQGVNYPVEKVEIKDTCGAGDTFVAGLVTNFVKTKNISEAIKFANDCATKVVQKKGVSIV